MYDFLDQVNIYGEAPSQLTRVKSVKEKKKKTTNRTNTIGQQLLASYFINSKRI
jgi:hypothetical protein